MPGAEVEQERGGAETVLPPLRGGKATCRNPSGEEQLLQRRTDGHLSAMAAASSPVVSTAIGLRVSACVGCVSVAVPSPVGCSRLTRTFLSSRPPFVRRLLQLWRRSRCDCLRSSRPHPSFLFSYHCTTAALSGRQPFHRPLLPWRSRGRWHSCRTHPVERTGPALCDTWHPVGPVRIGAFCSCLSACAARTAAILFVPVPLVCLPLLHSPKSGSELPTSVFLLLFGSLQIPL